MKNSFSKSHLLLISLMLFFSVTLPTDASKQLQRLAPISAQEINRAPPSTNVGATGAARRARTGSFLRLHNAEGSNESTYWQQLTSRMGKGTREISDAYVLIEIAAGKVFMTTNYIQVGYRDAPVINLAIEDLADANRMRTAIAQLFRGRNAVTVPLTLIADSGLESEQFNRIFDTDNQTLKINVSSFRRAELHMKGEKKVLSLVRIDRPVPPPRWASKLNKCCVRTGVPPDWTNWNRLDTIPFDRDNAQIISLFPDSETSRHLEHLDAQRHIRMPSEIPSDPMSALQRLIGTGDNLAPLIIIGHTENGNFVVEGHGGFSLPIEAIVELANQASRPLFLVGCYTAAHFRSHPEVQEYAGTLNELYPREVVPNIISAMRRAESMRDFTELISDSKMELWIPRDFLAQVDSGTTEVLHASIFKRAKSGVKSVVGFVYLFIPCKLSGRCT